MTTIAIFGCGDVGTTLGEMLIASGATVYAARRNPNTLPSHFHRVALDLADAGSFQGLPSHIDYAFYTAAAGRRDQDVYQRTYLDGLKNVINFLKRLDSAPARVFFTSSTGVYHQNKGESVNEDSATKPSYFSGKILLEAEELLLNCGLPATVVRFSGIYGPGRNYLLNQIRTTAIDLSMLCHYTNRIHRDDCASVLWHLMNLEKPDTVYVANDMACVTKREVAAWLAEQLGLTSLKAKIESTKCSVYTNKRVSNQKLLDSGYCFKYPTYKEGYRALIQAHGES